MSLRLSVYLWSLKLLNQLGISWRRLGSVGSSGGFELPLLPRGDRPLAMSPSDKYPSWPPIPNWPILSVPIPLSNGEDPSNGARKLLFCGETNPIWPNPPPCMAKPGELGRDLRPPNAEFCWAWSAKIWSRLRTWPCSLIMTTLPGMLLGDIGPCPVEPWPSFDLARRYFRTSSKAKRLFTVLSAANFIAVAFATMSAWVLPPVLKFGTRGVFTYNV